MIRRQTLGALLAMTAAISGHSQSPPAGMTGFAAELAAEPRLLRFEDAEVPRCNHLSLSTPAQINSQRSESGLTATILANFGCQTKAGDPGSGAMATRWSWRHAPFFPTTQHRIACAPAS
jgi:hypothetical protein